MEDHKIERINALSRKSKAEGLNDLEKEEQAALRKEYIQLFRANLINTLEDVSVEREGTVVHMKELRVQKNIKAVKE